MTEMLAEGSAYRAAAKLERGVANGEVSAFTVRAAQAAHIAWDPVGSFLHVGWILNVMGQVGEATEGPLLDRFTPGYAGFRASVNMQSSEFTTERKVKDERGGLGVLGDVARRCVRVHTVCDRRGGDIALRNATLFSMRTRVGTRKSVA